MREKIVKYLSGETSSKTSVSAAMADRWLSGALLNLILPVTLMGVWGSQDPESLNVLVGALKDAKLLPYMPAINAVVLTSLFTTIDYAGRRYTGNLEKPDNIVHMPLGAQLPRKLAMLAVMYGLLLQTVNNISIQYDKKDNFTSLLNAMYGDAVGASALQSILLVFLATVTNAAYVLLKQVCSDVSDAVFKPRADQTQLDDGRDESASTEENALPKESSCPKQLLASIQGLFSKTNSADTASLTRTVINGENTSEFFGARGGPGAR